MRPIARTTLALTAVALIAGCDRTPDPAAVEAAATQAAPAPVAEPAAPVQAEGGLAIEGEGLRIFDAAGAARALPFGTPQATVIAAVTAATGGIAPEQSTNAECGAGPTQFARYDDGLQLLFQDEKFAGWFLESPGLTTVDGVGVGTTRAALDAARTVTLTPDSTLGIEFSAGDVGGFLTAEGAAGTVESLYAGLTCFFR
ncbi:MAG: hypothetical protein Q8S03_12800 [Brevundimonas sp.]|uniref:hypothetical protein n=1 Tax=Brevundimonas sp. TaxID=1871086 RepID=UPI00273773E1|nr:hypothetical protein [Brevundimonas sp.]MDP3405566.1 hypothetical protein [Brevundimonas sp.]